MIDLDLTDEHEALVATVSEWGRRDVLPQIHDLDREHRFNRDFLARWPSCSCSASASRRSTAARAWTTSPRARLRRTRIRRHPPRVILSVHIGLYSLPL